MKEYRQTEIPYFDVRNAKQVEYIPNIGSQEEVTKVSVKNDSIKGSNNFGVGIGVGLLASILILVCVFAGVLFWTAKKDAVQNSNQQKSTPTPTALRRIVNTENLNLRKSPDRFSNVVEILPYNTEVELLQKTELVNGKYWTKVKSGNAVGWVNREYLR